jgi:nucleoside-diphosphate-sugar epimerase
LLDSGKRLQFLTPSESNSALITGGGGFVGTCLCGALAQRGWRVVAVSRRGRNCSMPSGVVEASLPLFSNSDDWQRKLSSISCVVHLAAHVHRMGPGAKRDPQFREVNVEGSRFVAEQAARAGVRRFVFLSSIKVNGEGGPVPYSADDQPNPRDLYAITKLEAEIALREVCLRSGMELVVVRPPLIYGPGVRGNFRRLMNLAYLGVPLPFRSISNSRSLIGIWNLAHFIESCMAHPAAAGQTWLVSDGEDLSTPQLFAKLATLMNRRARLFPVSQIWLRRISKIAGLSAEIARLCDSLQVDTTPARDRLAWRPPMTVDEGLTRTVTAYRTRR